MSDSQCDLKAANVALRAEVERLRIVIQSYAGSMQAAMDDIRRYQQVIAAQRVPLTMQLEDKEVANAGDKEA